MAFANILGLVIKVATAKLDKEVALKALEMTSRHLTSVYAGQLKRQGITLVSETLLGKELTKKAIKGNKALQNIVKVTKEYNRIKEMDVDVVNLKTSFLKDGPAFLKNIVLDSALSRGGVSSKIAKAVKKQEEYYERKEKADTKKRREQLDKWRAEQLTPETLKQYKKSGEATKRLIVKAKKQAESEKNEAEIKKLRAQAEKKISELQNEYKDITPQLKHKMYSEKKKYTEKDVDRFKKMFSEKALDKKSVFVPEMALKENTPAELLQDEELFNTLMKAIAKDAKYGFKHDIRKSSQFTGAQPHDVMTSWLRNMIYNKDKSLTDFGKKLNKKIEKYNIGLDKLNIEPLFGENAAFNPDKVNLKLMGELITNKELGEQFGKLFKTNPDIWSANILNAYERTVSEYGSYSVFRPEGYKEYITGLSKKAKETYTRRHNISGEQYDALIDFFETPAWQTYRNFLKRNDISSDDIQLLKELENDSEMAKKSIALTPDDIKDLENFLETGSIKSIDDLTSFVIKRNNDRIDEQRDK